MRSHGWLLTLLGVLACLFVFPGCALLNESSAAQRADTYDVTTTFTVDPSSGKIRYVSTGDDSLHAEGIEVGGNKIQKIDIEQKRSPVVLAQGQRAKDITDLMGQQIQLNQVWMTATIEALREVRGVVADLAPQIIGLRKTIIETDAAREAATRAMIEDAIRGAIEVRSGVRLPGEEGTQARSDEATKGGE